MRTGEPFAGECLVIPAGAYKVRSNDCTYRFRVYSVFVHPSGLEGERKPDSVLVLEPEENDSYEATLYFKPHTSRSAQEFYSDPQYGGFWVSACPSLEEVRREMSLRCIHIDTLPDTLTKDAGGVKLRIVRGVDASIKAVVNEIREQTGFPFGKEARSAGKVFEEHLSEIQLHKDVFELAELARVVEVTRAGFEDIMRVPPQVMEHHRGGCVTEGAFGVVAYEEGNDLGYDTIAASSNHANTLYWIDDDGSANEGNLILVDAGIEVDSLYTADITHILLINGRFTEVQACAYQAVLDACEAALARANKSGTRFCDVHDTAMFIVATCLREWGLLPVSVEESLFPAGWQHRHWMPHDTGHRLGLGVHDCAQAHHEIYQNTLLESDMTFMIEPSLYFRADDETIPAEYRGIGVRVEDDVVVSEDGSVTRISEDVPRTIDDAEIWIARTQGR